MREQVHPVQAQVDTERLDAKLLTVSFCFCPPAASRAFADGEHQGRSHQLKIAALADRPG
jgi:hypothetical protein